ncbi:CDP-diacylglycerol--serine O-phosphatidyltransferase [Paenibacillus sp. P96]|uniref:CDP-diacylglycerol--serine O-phosphatidyltransferase n=1 Tax=Paenibacillus zeirhizosphaerae TaxID=2987519 RepID=A0ABT9FS90_9BACL|nr:CDP-diacylglycerol--serine O-phosphatidyltransferase [Paenibacillus sp. P96]MDP4097592.1 CDP-diacylglycerol--serine O-phosphatidyltransferase [Paenibacillus sp. P96]
MRLRWTPSLLTACNLAAGVCSVLAVSRSWYVLAALLIFASMLFDLFDGYIARRIGVEAEFGKQLDSLADIVSFGLAPSFLINVSIFHDWNGVLGGLLVIFFTLCGAFRLARFNLSSFSKTFTGLPITAAGSLLALLSLAEHRLTDSFFAAVMLVFSLLMISRLPFPSIKKESAAYQNHKHGK